MAKVGVYIDGFNLYYGELENSRFKWLDLSALAQQILAETDDVKFVKYFTANVDGKAAPRQRIYHKALETHCSNVEIIRGQFRTHPTWLKPVSGGQRNCPTCTPRFLADAIPAFVRSPMRLRSNSANAPIT